jgi:hypothetical protein
MSDDLHRDAVDDELARRFGASASPGADPDVVLDGMRPRLQRARTRRRASLASAVAGTALAAVLLVLMLSGGGGGVNSVRTPPASNGPIHTVPPAPSVTDAGGSPAPEGTGDEHEDSVEAPSTAPDAATPSSTPLAEPPTQPAASDSTYTSDGGSIVVHFADGAVSLVSSSPATGFTAEIHDNGPTRVEVRFNNGTIEWRIRVDVVNGALQPEITQH